MSTDQLDLTGQWESCQPLLDEIGNFYAGFGNGDALLETVRTAALLVPITADTRVVTWEYNRIRWIPAFTDQAKLATFAAGLGFKAPTAVSPGDPPPRVASMFGWRLFDQILPDAVVPTGVVVDITSPYPMGFPPVREFSPLAYLDFSDLKDGEPAWVTVAASSN